MRVRDNYRERAAKLHSADRKRTLTIARFPLQICAKLKQYFYEMSIKHNCEMTAFPLMPCGKKTKCFLLSCQVIPRCTTMDVLNFSGFISSATTANAVIKLSPPLQRFSIILSRTFVTASGSLMYSCISLPLQILYRNERFF